ncbi:enoyl-CoA hydratase [Diaphorobacter sp. HDW4A]|uniref:enoyl-CoA hydratase/isomerase family protein n=1 Tax=Diaphorobacter sp. HDW4A TaxID=2714924 RepID=UPI001407BC63|nr:enoyl-CoA hydratase-related protein [Diaphorobacter sp. HDW4A]QIL80747.1 enoyl-CoA hydratase [Diaphorobacter sp. HDW4A]
MNTLIVERNASTGVALVTLNRPAVLNAFNTEMWQELWSLLRELAFDTSLRCVVFQGAGERAFSAGGDLKERNGMTDAQWAAQHQLIEDVLLAIRDFPRPVIAALQGIAHGGGLELALMCDFIIADTSADLALPESKRGFLPGGGGMQNLVRAIGVRKTKQMLYSGARLNAQTAFDWGIFNELTPAGQHLARAMEIAQDIARAAPQAVRSAKLTLQHGADTDFRTGYALDLAHHNLLVRSPDRLEGIRAFNEKREPQWTQQ